MPSEATYKVILNKKDISANISADLISLDYTDEVAGQSDELSITLQDSKGLWKYEWYPEKGDELQAYITVNGKTLDCGIFEIDEVEASGSKDAGDVVIIKALAAGIKDSVRTVKSYAHENKTLREVAATTANKYGFKLVGEIPNIILSRQTQHRETDLHFLASISAENGLQFSLRNKQLIFTSIFNLESGNPVFSFVKSDLIDYNIKDKTADTYVRATSSHFSPKKKKLITMTIEYGVVTKNISTPKHDYLEIKTRTENEQQAELKSKAALYRANTLQQEGTIVIPGNVLVVSGINIELQQLGMMSGLWHITKSHHKVHKENGYTTTPEIKRVNTIAKEKMKQPDA